MNQSEKAARLAELHGKDRAPLLDAAFEAD